MKSFPDYHNKPVAKAMCSTESEVMEKVVHLEIFIVYEADHLIKIPGNGKVTHMTAYMTPVTYPRAVAKWLAIPSDIAPTSEVRLIISNPSTARAAP